MKSCCSTDHEKKLHWASLSKTIIRKGMCYNYWSKIVNVLYSLEKQAAIIVNTFQAKFSQFEKNAFGWAVVFLSLLFFQYGGDNSSSGADYFDGNLFGYAVYGMFGLFLLALAVGLFWQYYPREKKAQEIQNRKGKLLQLNICCQSLLQGFKFLPTFNRLVYFVS